MTTKEMIEKIKNHKDDFVVRDGKVWILQESKRHDSYGEIVQNEIAINKAYEICLDIEKDEIAARQEAEKREKREISIEEWKKSLKGHRLPDGSVIDEDGDIMDKYLNCLGSLPNYIVDDVDKWWMETDNENEEE